MVGAASEPSTSVMRVRVPRRGRRRGSCAACRGRREQAFITRAASGSSTRASRRCSSVASSCWRALAMARAAWIDCSRVVEKDGTCRAPLSGAGPGGVGPVLTLGLWALKIGVPEARFKRNLSAGRSQGHALSPRNRHVRMRRRRSRRCRARPASEVVLAPADLGEDLGVGATGHPHRRLEAGVVGAQERVGRRLLGEPRRDGGLARGRGPRGSRSARACSAALPPSTDSAKRAFDSVYSWPEQTTVSAGRARSVCERRPTSARPCPRTAARSPAPSGCRPRTAARAGQVVGDVADRVAGHVDHPRLLAADRDPLAGLHREVERRQAVGVGLRRRSRGRPRAARPTPCDVVVVVVGDEDVRRGASRARRARPGSAPPRARPRGAVVPGGLVVEQVGVVVRAGRAR